MKKTTVHPTHTCFDDALDLLVEMLQAEPDRFLRGDLVLRLRLVHGRCLAPDGHAYAHAWVENVATQQTYFVGIVKGNRVVLVAARSEYYPELQVQDVTRYTYPEALRWNRESGHYGPWTAELRALCGGTKTWAAGTKSQ